MTFTSTLRRGQVTLAELSPAWLNNIVINMTQHLHCFTTKSSAFASMTQQHRTSMTQRLYRQHDSAALS
jgi:hypothetical protein